MGLLLFVRPSEYEDLRKLAEKFIVIGGEFASNDPLRWVLRGKDGNSVRVLIALVDEHGPKIPLDDPQLDWVEFEVPRQESVIDGCEREDVTA